MNAKEAHSAAVKFLSEQELTQKVLLDIETMAGQGKFHTQISSDLEIETIVGIQRLLKDLGYEVNLISDYGGKILNINW